MTYPVTYLYLLNAIFIVISATVTILAAQRQASKYLLVAAMPLAAGWAFCDFFSNLAQTPEQLRFMTHVAAFAWSPIPILVLLGVATYAYGTKRVMTLPVIAGAILPVLAILAFVLSGVTHSAFIPAAENNGFFNRVATPWQPLISVYFMIATGAAGGILLALARKSRLCQHRRSAKLFFLLFIPLTIIGSALNGGLTLAGVETPFLGSIFAGAIVTIAAVSVLKIGLLEPIHDVQKERDEARARLMERDAVLSAVPNAVAICAPNNHRPMFTNRVFDELGEMLGGETFFERLRGELQDATTAECIADRELSIEVDGHEGPMTLELFATTIENEPHQEAILVSLRDITLRKRLEERLGRSHRLESLGTLAGGVAHDLNNVLASILLTAEVVSDDYSPDDPQWQDLAGIVEACKRGRETTRNLLGFARGGQYRRQRVALSEVVREVHDVLSRTLPERVEIRVERDERNESPESGCVVMGDPNQLNHLLMNLCLNGVDAMEGRGRMTLGIAKRELTQEDIVDFPELSPGDYIELTVSDTGRGMDEETQRRCFEPLYTTKPPGKGTGLGLSMVYGTTKRHGGDVSLRSTLEQGTTVTVLLPCVDETALESSPSTPGSKPEPSRDEKDCLQTDLTTILLVDDDELVRSAGRSLLQRLGYQVELAADGIEAVEVVELKGDTIAGVILDMRMPRMDGPAAFDAMRALQPNLKVVIASGHSPDDDTTRLLEAGALRFIEKPFDASTLKGVLCDCFGVG